MGFVQSLHQMLKLENDLQRPLFLEDHHPCCLCLPANLKLELSETRISKYNQHSQLTDPNLSGKYTIYDYCLLPLKM